MEFYIGMTQYQLARVFSGDRMMIIGLTAKTVEAHATLIHIEECVDNQSQEKYFLYLKMLIILVAASGIKWSDRT